MQGAWGFSTGLRPTKTPVEKCEIILGRQDDVPAFSDIARGQAQNPKHYSFISSRLPQSVFDASEPSSVFSPRSCRRLYFRLFGLFRRLYFRLFGLFRRLCRRCIWNILLKIVDVETIQDQICMFQDSVPAGSYNDPFLSSVCDKVVWQCCGWQSCGWQSCVWERCAWKSCVRKSCVWQSCAR